MIAITRNALRSKCTTNRLAASSLSWMKGMGPSGKGEGKKKEGEGR